MKRLPQLALTALVLTAVGPILHADVVFNFDSDPIGRATGFTDTVGGVSATFTSSGDPGGFAVMPSFFKSLTGNVLLDPGPADRTNLTLSILFSAAESNISMNFATDSLVGVPFELDAFNGARLVGSASATGSVPVGFLFAEGLISFGGGTFDRVVLSVAAAPFFAIDNVTVSPVNSVPEPASFSLCAIALGALALLKRQRSQS